jgi:hypothetical protein
MRIGTRLPKTITATRKVNYKVDNDLINSIAEAREIETDEVTLDLILDWIADWAIEDLSSAHVQIVFRDEHNEELGTM